jgi:hypothetical protein
VFLQTINGEVISLKTKKGRKRWKLQKIALLWEEIIICVGSTQCGKDSAGWYPSLGTTRHDERFA